MVRALRRYFVNGVIIIVPIGIIIFVIVQVFNFLDGLVGNGWLEIAGHPVPGVGVAATLALILLIGALATQWFGRAFFLYLDTQMKRVPLIKSVYSILKDTVESFVGYRQGFERVVLVTMPSTDAEVLGFVTRSGGLPEFGAAGEGKIAVFVPLSFQMTGMTLIVPADRVKNVDMTVEQGIRYTLSAGLAREGLGGPDARYAARPSPSQRAASAAAQREREQAQAVGEAAEEDARAEAAVGVQGGEA